MKGLLRHLPWVKRKHEIQRVANRIASRSLQTVWQRVTPRCMLMCPAEARGYIRSRAGLVVDREMGVAGTAWAESYRHQVYENSLKLVVAMTIEQIRELHRGDYARKAA